MIQPRQVSGDSFSIINFIGMLILGYFFIRVFIFLIVVFIWLLSHIIEIVMNFIGYIFDKLVKIFIHLIRGKKASNKASLRQMDELLQLRYFFDSKQDKAFIFDFNIEDEEPFYIDVLEGYIYLYYGAESNLLRIEFRDRDYLTIRDIRKLPKKFQYVVNRYLFKNRRS